MNVPEVDSLKRLQFSEYKRASVVIIAFGPFLTQVNQNVTRLRGRITNSNVY